MVHNVIKNTAKFPCRLLLSFLETIENRVILNACLPLYSPIFIIGVPRSGTTLLYQVMAYYFDVCYISNLMERHSKCPCVLSYFLSSISGCNPPKDFNSRYGVTSGWQSPAQGWSFWNRWFPGEGQNYVGLGEIPVPLIKKLRNTILLLENIYKKPFVNKALSLSARILPLNQAFPEALFVRVRRNRLDVAQSILKGRKEYTGDKNKWFSVVPSEFDKIKDKDCITQVCGQIFYLEKDMDRDIKRIGGNRCIDVNYSDLCENPKSVISKIEQFYNNQNSFARTLKKKYTPEDPFYLSQGKKCCDDEYRMIQECFRNFYGVNY